MVRPVAPEVIRSSEVDMSVLQFPHHVAEHLEELHVRHFVVDHRLIASMHLIPVHTQCLLFVVEEAIALIHQLPECLKVAATGVGRCDFLLHAR